MSDIFTPPADNPRDGVVPELPTFIPPEPAPLRYPAALDINEAMMKLTVILSIVRPKLLFVPSYPDFVIDVEGKKVPYPTAPDETVTWKVVKREPGVLNGAPFQGGNKEVQARTREAQIDHLKDYRELGTSEQLFEYKGQFMDNLVQFDCWSKTNKQVVELLEWFEEFMFEFKRLFQEMGVHKTYFWERADDVILFQYRNGLNFRSTKYFFRTEKVYAIRLHLIEEIRHRMAVLGSNEVVSQVIN